MNEMMKIKIVRINYRYSYTTVIMTNVNRSMMTNNLINNIRDIIHNNHNKIIVIHNNMNHCYKIITNLYNINVIIIVNILPTKITFISYLFKVKIYFNKIS